MNETGMAETETTYMDAPGNIDRISFAELLAEPGMTDIEVRIVDDQNQPRCDLGTLRHANLMSPRQAMERVQSLIRSGLANYSGMAIIGLSATDDARTMLRTMTFTAQGRGAMTFERGSSSSDGGGDVVSSLVRQNEFLLRVVVGTQAAVISENQDLRRQAREDDKMRLQFIRDREEFLSQKQDRELTAKMMETEIESRKQLKERLMTLAQLGYNKISGREQIRMQQSPFEVASFHALQVLQPKLDALVDAGALTPQDKLMISTWFETGVNSLMVTPEQKAEAQKRMHAMTGGTVASDPGTAPAAPNGGAVAGSVIADILRSLGVQTGVAR